MQALFSWIAHYGYAALFALLMFGIVGLPIPDETLLFFCGYLIWKGQLRFEFTFLAGFAGSCCGISLSYIAGRKWGRRLVHHYGPRFHFTHERTRQVYRWFHRIGSWSLTIGYFVPGVRHFTALVAGMARLRYTRFALFAYFGAAIWVGTFLVLGYVVGEGWERTSEMVHRYLLIAAAIAGGALGMWWYFRSARTNRTRVR